MRIRLGMRRNLVFGIERNLDILFFFRDPLDEICPLLLGAGLEKEKREETESIEREGQPPVGKEDTVGGCLSPSLSSVSSPTLMADTVDDRCLIG